MNWLRACAPIENEKAEEEDSTWNMLASVPSPLEELKLVSGNPVEYEQSMDTYSSSGCFHFYYDPT